MEEQKESLNSKVDKLIRLNEELITKKEVKKWKLPWNARLNKGQVKKNYATYCIINDNKAVKFLRAPIEDGVVSIDGVPRISTADYCLNYENKPFFIMNTASIEPYDVRREVKDSEERNMAGVAGRRLLLAKMEKEAIKPKGAGFGSMGWIILIVAVCAAGYFLIKGGKIF